jgi:hypothetical protein
VLYYKNCPVHSFYLNDGEGFLKISQKTKGKTAPFDIKSKKITDDLTAFVVSNIL